MGEHGDNPDPHGTYWVSEADGSVCCNGPDEAISLDECEVVRLLNETEIEIERLNGQKIQQLDREFMGRVVRASWVEWAMEQPNPKPHWLEPWEALDGDMQEVDMRIAEAVMNIAICPAVLELEQEIERLRGREGRLAESLRECADNLTPGQWNDGRRERAKDALAGGKGGE